MNFSFKKLLLVTTALFFSIYIFGKDNSFKKQLIDVKELMAREDFTSAADQLEKMLVENPGDKELSLNLGICYISMDGNESKAIKYLETAVSKYPMKKKKNSEAIESRFYLGQAYHLNYNFNKAIETLEALKNEIPPHQKDLLSQIDKELQYNYNALELSKHPLKFKITNLGPTINTPYDEHSPVVSADETVLIFTSNRKGTGDLQTPDGLYYEDLYISQFRHNQWTEAENMGLPINTEGNNASICLSADGKTLLIYQHDGISGDIYKSEMTFDGWSTPEKLPRPINSQYSETHASISVDGNTLFFSSDRPGGFGKKDIYMVRKLPDGEWGKIINLGPAVNTDGDEESPFIHPDGKTLYFCSTEHKSMGGYDIFKTTLNDSSEWSTPVNIGYPINTPDDDLFYIPTANGLRVYFASRRAGGEGRSDIYLIEFDENDPRSLGVVAGYIFNKKGEVFSEVTITLTDKETGEIMGYYRPNPSTGKYVMIVPVGKSYEATYVSVLGEIKKEIDVPGRASYSSGNWATYLDAVVVDDNEIVH